MSGIYRDRTAGLAQFVERVTCSTAEVRNPAYALNICTDLRIFGAAYRNRTDDLRITSASL
jgi:hypothetical protein